MTTVGLGHISPLLCVGTTQSQKITPHKKKLAIKNQMTYIVDGGGVATLAFLDYQLLLGIGSQARYAQCMGATDTEMVHRLSAEEISINRRVISCFMG